MISRRCGEKKDSYKSQNYRFGKLRSRREILRIELVAVCNMRHAFVEHIAGHLSEVSRVADYGTFQKPWAHKASNLVTALFLDLYLLYSWLLFDTKLESSEREIISYSLLKDKVCVLGERKKKSQATAAFVHAKVQRLSVFMALLSYLHGFY